MKSVNCQYCLLVNAVGRSASSGQLIKSTDDCGQLGILESCHLQIGQNFFSFKGVWTIFFFKYLVNYKRDSEKITKWVIFSSETTDMLFHNGVITYSQPKNIKTACINFYFETLNCILMLVFQDLLALSWSVIAVLCHVCFIIPLHFDLTALLSSPPTPVYLPPSLCGISCSCSSSFPGCVSTCRLPSLDLAPSTASSPATASRSTPPASWRGSSSPSGSLCNAGGTRRRGVGPPRGPRWASASRPAVHA